MNGKHYVIVYNKKRNMTKILLPVFTIVIIAISSVIINNIYQKKYNQYDEKYIAKVSAKLDFSTEIENIPIDENILLDEETIQIIKDEIEKNGANNEENKNAGNKYYIKVNVSANTVTIYENDGDGNYNPIKAMVCSTGGATPRSGQYKVTNNYYWQPLFGDVYGHYCTRIGYTNILFHSVPYTENYNSGSLEYWEFDKLGTSASMGCIRLQIKDTQWIYSNIPSGTIVEFYEDSNPGPLGKPSAPKISSNERCRNWDPTDYDSDNPWLNEDSLPSTDSNQEPKSEQEPEQKANEEPENHHEENKEEIPDNPNNNENLELNNNTIEENENSSGEDDTVENIESVQGE